MLGIGLFVMIDLPTIRPSRAVRNRITTHSSTSWRTRKIPMLSVKVVPGSGRNEIVGWLGNSLKIRVSAVPKRGNANHAIVSLLADALRIRRKNVTISSGTASPRKVVRINGLSESEIRSRLSELES